MTTYRPLSRAKVDEELWETEGERGVGRGEKVFLWELSLEKQV